MALKTSKLGDKKNDHNSILIHGDPEAGKTRLTEQFGFLLKKKADGTPDWSRLLFVDGERGYESIAHLKDIAVWTPFIDGKPFELVSELNPAVKGAGGGSMGKFDVVVVDGLFTIFNDIFQAFEKEADKANPGNPNMQGVWGSYGKAAYTWVSQMARTPSANVVFLTHTEEWPEATPRFVPKTVGGNFMTPAALLGMFNYVFYMHWSADPKLGQRRMFRTTRDPKRGGDPRYAVKSRFRDGVEPLPALYPALPSDGGGIEKMYQSLFPKTEGGK